MIGPYFLLESLVLSTTGWMIASYFGGAVGRGAVGYQGGWMQQQQRLHEHGASMGGMEMETDEKGSFEYRGKDGNVHGPYGASQMKAWVQQARIISLGDTL